MQLIGMLDSPYVRRVAVSLQLLGLRFEHQSVSVFSTFDQFQKINPIVKAPTLICDDGDMLMDSTLILQYAEALAAPRKSLMPATLPELRHSLRVTGLALAACEKSMQIVYERNLRPAEKLHQPWVDRITGQLHAALAALEASLRDRPLDATTEGIGQAGVTTAVSWHFILNMTADVVDAGNYPTLHAYSRAAEALPAFAAAPHGNGVYRDQR
jgi:glutathione S-transferase